MANTKVIKQKIKTIGSIKKITKTMEMVSFVKMKKANDEVIKITPYINEVKKLIERLIISTNEEKHELFSLYNNHNNLNKKINLSEVIIIFASNKGLCGSYNSNIYKQTKKYLENNKNISKAICISKFSERIAKRLNLEIVESYLEIDKMNNLDFLKLEKYLREGFLSNDYYKIHVSYTNFVRNGVYEAISNCIYPLSKDINKYILNLDQIKHNINSDKKLNDMNFEYIFEPNIKNILSSLVPKLVSVVLYSYLLESRASEHSIRSFAMKRATDSATEMQKDLQIKYNRVRQDSITQEIAEISAGANIN